MIKPIISIICLLFFVFFANTLFAQKSKAEKIPPPPPTFQSEKREARNHSCVKKNTIPLNLLLKKYPFEVSAQVQFVSFAGGIYEKNGKKAVLGSLPRINDSIVYADLKEVKNLTYPQVAQLTDIFYNYGFRGKIYKISDMRCYMPRNAILFLDNKGKVIEFIEICFECHIQYLFPDTLGYNEINGTVDCKENLLSSIKEIFKNNGIRYGIDER